MAHEIERLLRDLVAAFAGVLAKGRVGLVQPFQPVVERMRDAFELAAGLDR
jgi:hypothetical protein